MAGATNGIFPEKTSPFLRKKMDSETGERRSFLDLQYLHRDDEDVIRENEVRRHYESEVSTIFEGEPLDGVERLYKQTVLIEPTTICAAHCRWCIRGQYITQTLKPQDLERAARYCGSPELRDDIKEVLVTGGDPLMLTQSLDRLLDAIAEHAPNVRVVRLATRIPLQAPERINDTLLEAIRPRGRFRVEIGTHINHPGELFPEVREACNKLRTVVSAVYDQTVLLRGVNNDRETLLKLYDAMRDLDIEPHYLFHCVPLRGMGHHRTSVDEGLRLHRDLMSSGELSGRTKPHYTLMTDIGKVTLYEGTIADRDKTENKLLLRTNYRYSDRLRWVPSWQLPDSALVEDDYLLVRYQDAQ